MKAIETSPVEILQQPSKKMEDLNESIRQNPHNASLYSKRANFRKKYLGDDFGAISDYTKAIKLNPNNALLYFWRSRIYYDIGNKKQAIEDYNYAMKLAPEDTMYGNLK